MVLYLCFFVGRDEDCDWLILVWWMTVIGRC